MPFPTELPEDATIGQVYGPAMEITTQADADAYFAIIVAHIMRFGRSQTEAEAIARENIGYYSGYYDHATADRALALFNTEHPIFGRQHPTPEEAFRKGLEYGERGRKPTS